MIGDTAGVCCTDYYVLGFVIILFHCRLHSQLRYIKMLLKYNLQFIQFLFTSAILNIMLGLSVSKMSVAICLDLTGEEFSRELEATVIIVKLGLKWRHL